MIDIYYEELRRNCAESTKFTVEQMDKVINSVKNVLKFHEVARKEGILALEAECESLNKETEEKYFTELLSLVVDGIDPKLLSEYGLSRYCAANLPVYEGIIYLIYFKGAHMIQAGESPFPVELILEGMLPENVRKLYMEKRERKPRS